MQLQHLHVLLDGDRVLATPDARVVTLASGCRSSSHTLTGIHALQHMPLATVPPALLVAKTS